MLGKRLKELRESRDLTQQELAKIINLSQQTIGHYEVGRAKPDVDTLNLLANFFGTTVDYLLSRTNIKDPIETIAAHHDSEDWTKEELEDIEKFKEFVRSRRKSKS
jgi:transcriptional regulator with XRE-family HTH domain